MKKILAILLLFSMSITVPAKAGIIDGIGKIFGIELKYSKKKISNKLDNVQSEMNGIKGDVAAVKENTLELNNNIEATLKFNASLENTIKLAIQNEMKAYAQMLNEFKVSVGSQDSSNKTNQQGDGNVSFVNQPEILKTAIGALLTALLLTIRMWYKTNLAFINSRKEVQEKDKIVQTKDNEVREAVLKIKDFKRSFFEKKRELDDTRLMLKTMGINVNGVENNDTNKE